MGIHNPLYPAAFDKAVALFEECSGPDKERCEDCPSILECNCFYNSFVVNAQEATEAKYLEKVRAKLEELRGLSQQMLKDGVLVIGENKSQE